MSVTNKSIIFLALTFLWSWGIAVGGHFAGLPQAIDTALGAPGGGATIILVAMMAGPAIAALICALAFEKGRRVQALGLHFKPNIWWLWAWLIPIAISFASLGFTLLLTDQHYVDMGEATRRAVEAQGQDPAQIRPFVMSTGFLIFMSIGVGALINTIILTFTEELGWRGYLYDLWRPSGFWRTAIVTGFIWGFWHAPAIYLYGHNYPTQPVWGVLIFTLYCVPLAILHTHVRERGNSVFAAGILHGTFNAVPGLSIVTLSNPEFPWTGIVGIGGMIAVSIAAGIVVWLRRDAKPRSAPAAAS